MEGNFFFKLKQVHLAYFRCLLSGEMNYRPEVPGSAPQTMKGARAGATLLVVTFDQMQPDKFPDSSHLTSGINYSI